MDPYSLGVGMGAGIGFTVFCFILVKSVHHIVDSAFSIIKDIIETRRLKKSSYETSAK